MGRKESDMTEVTEHKTYPPPHAPAAAGLGRVPADRSSTRSQGMACTPKSCSRQDKEEVLTPCGCPTRPAAAVEGGAPPW